MHRLPKDLSATQQPTNFKRQKATISSHFYTVPGGTGEDPVDLVDPVDQTTKLIQKHQPVGQRWKVTKRIWLCGGLQVVHGNMGYLWGNGMGTEGT